MNKNSVRLVPALTPQMVLALTPQGVNPMSICVLLFIFLKSPRSCLQFEFWRTCNITFCCWLRGRVSLFSRYRHGLNSSSVPRCRCPRLFLLAGSNYHHYQGSTKLITENHEVTCNCLQSCFVLCPFSKCQSYDSCCGVLQGQADVLSCSSGCEFIIVRWDIRVTLWTIFRESKVTYYFFSNSFGLAVSWALTAYFSASSGCSRNDVVWTVKCFSKNFPFKPHQHLSISCLSNFGAKSFWNLVKVVILWIPWHERLLSF